ncbi:MAG: hypothetical protein ACFCUM_05880 [Bacteroidales bacterium]
MKTSIKLSNMFKTAGLFLFSLAIMSSCNKDEVKNGTFIKFKSTYEAPVSTAGLKSTAAESVVIESFKINIEEIEIEFNDNDPLFATDSVATDYELDGPFEIDLLTDGNALETTIVKNVELPVAAYDEIEFKFRESENSISEMFGKSLLIKGTINGTPFIFWTDEEIEVEIEFEEVFSMEEASLALLTVSFDIASLFDPAKGGIDLSNAADGNENGTIEIYPGDPDGNNDLADMLWEKLENIIEAFEDSMDD